MVDTIKGYIELKNYKKDDFKELLKECKKTKTKNGCTKTVNVLNFIVTISFDKNYKPIKMFFNGSLPKFFYGNNLKQLNLETTKKAIQMLSDNLNVDISKAILTRVDFGTNILLKYPVYEYISCLLLFPRLGTMRFKETVTFFTSSNSKKYLFYDKIAEIKKGRKNDFHSINEDYLLDKNILRYEIQLKDNLGNRFRLKKVKVKELFKVSFQRKLMDFWFNGYHKIEKISLGSDPDFLLKENDGLRKYLSYIGLEKIGRDRLESKISRLKFDVKNNSVKISKMRSKIKKILNEANKKCLDKNLIKELDSKILEVKNNFL